MCLFIHLESELVMKLTSHLAKQSTHERVPAMERAQKSHSVIKLPSGLKTSFDVVAIVDPTSKQAQLIAPVVKVLVCAC